MVSCNAGPSSLVFFWGMLNSLRWWFTDCSVRRIKKTKCPKPVLIVRIHWYIFNINAVHVLQNTKNVFWVHIRVLWSPFPLHWKPNILLVIMTADDSIKCRCANSGMTSQVGGFQNPGVCLQAFPSFPPHPLPALLLTPFFARCLTLVPRSLLLNRTETLARQAKLGLVWVCLKPVNLLVSQYRPLNLPEKMSFSFFVL